MYWLRLSPLLFLLSAIACNKIISAETANPVIEEPTATTSFEGVVLDDMQQPIAGATVTCSGKSVLTADDGTFQLSNVKVDSNAAFIAVQKTGFLNGTRTLMAHSYGQQYLQVTMAPKDLTTSFNAAAVGNVNFSGLTLVFSPYALLNKDRQAYKGPVSIAADYLSPASPDFGTRMSGDLRGLDGGGNEVGLRSFGQVAVDMLDTAGNIILPDGSHAVNITMNIPGPYRSSAPAQIGLWYLDTISGYWKQETIAYKSGNNYMGNVRNGTRWQFAVAYPVVTLEADIFQETGTPAARLQTTFMTKIDFIPSYGFINSAGHFTGKVPLNQQLIFTLTDHCGNNVFQKELGPYSANSLVNNLITGNLVLCQP